MKKRPRLYFAFRSPYSWMALRRLEELLPDAPSCIDYFPYWEPSGKVLTDLAARGAAFHYEPMSKAKHLYLLADTKRLAQGLGYDLKWPIDVDPSWDLPHLAWIQARRAGLEREFYRAVTEARWERAENICDPAVVRRAAESVGLDGSVAVRAGDDPQIRAEGVQALVTAYEDDVFGIPYFKVGHQRFWGLDRLDAFVAAVEPVLRTGTSAASPDSGADPLAGFPRQLLHAGSGYDRDTAGGCG